LSLHIEQGIRSASVRSINKHSRYHLVVPLLKSKDARGRHTGLTCITGMSKGKALPTAQLTDEMFNLVADMINDPDEAWWVVEAALNAMGRARSDLIAPYVKRLSYWLRHDDWWLRKAAMTALTPVATDKRFYKQILPIIGKMIATNERAVALNPVSGIVRKLQTSDPEVQQFAVKVLGQSYIEFPTTLAAPGGQDLSDGVAYLLKGIASNLADAPGGFDALYEVSAKRFPEQSLPHKELYMKADSSKFGSKVQAALKPIILKQLIPEYIAAGNHIRSNREYLHAEARSSEPLKWNFYYREPRMAELVRLYNRIGVHEYDWHLFGPDLNEIKWDYYMFDPPEEKLWAPGARYRKVTYPKRMENWFAPEFDATKAGWKSGWAPFGQCDGKPEICGRKCRYSFCRHDEPIRTLWDKEVLIMRTKIKFPAFKEGYCYRLLVGGMSNVNRGEGYRVYVDGKQMMERDRGVGRREGGRPLCFYIDKGWWTDFEDEVTIAATSFLQFNFKTSKTQQHFSIWLQEMKAPPLGEK